MMRRTKRMITLKKLTNSYYGHRNNKIKIDTCNNCFSYYQFADSNFS